jgi:hypothetical protein
MVIFLGIIAVVTLLLAIAPTTASAPRRTAKQCFWMSTGALTVIQIAKFIMHLEGM